MRDYQIRILPFDLLDITEYEGLKAVNDHGYVRFSGTIPNERENDYIELALGEVWPEVVVLDGNGETRTIFFGLLKDFQIRTENNVKTLSGEIVAGTYKMDLSPHIRTFQSSGLTYDSLNSTITGGYSNANYIMRQGSGTAIQNLVAQYEETDWKFAKRLASHFHTVLVPDYTVGGIKYYFGVPLKNKAVEISANEYTILKQVDEYNYKVENGVSGISEKDAVCCLWRSRDLYEIGDKIILNSMPLYVSKVESGLEGSELYHLYYLKSAGGYKVPKIFNQKVTGASLNGNIIGVQADVVMVHLSGDENAGGAGTRWFNYSTVYSSPSGAGWYCMPEMGDTIRLYFPSSDETEAYVASSTHLETGSNRAALTSEPTDEMQEEFSSEASGFTASAAAEVDGEFTMSAGMESGRLQSRVAAMGRSRPPVLSKDNPTANDGGYKTVGSVASSGEFVNAEIGKRENPLKARIESMGVPGSPVQAKFSASSPSEFKAAGAVANSGEFVNAEIGKRENPLKARMESMGVPGSPIQNKNPAADQGGFTAAGSISAAAEISSDSQLKSRVASMGLSGSPVLRKNLAEADSVVGQQESEAGNQEFKLTAEGFSASAGMNKDGGLEFLKNAQLEPAQAGEISSPGETADNAAYNGGSYGSYGNGNGASGGGYAAGASAAAPVSSGGAASLPAPRSDPNTKTLSNASGKTIALTPDSIVITDGTSQILLDGEGISLSGPKISMTAEGEISITSSAGDVSISGSTKVNIAQDGASVELNDNIKVTGEKLYMD